MTEADLIHRALFPGRAIPPDVIERYDAARVRFFSADPDAPLVALLLERQLDAEAVEFALRLRGANGLTRRFQVMLSLCEVRSAYDDAFVQRSRSRAVWGAPWLLLRASWKLARGWYLLRRHRLLERRHV